MIDRATACPAQAIVITGGEPLLYPLGVLTEMLQALVTPLQVSPVIVQQQVRVVARAEA